MTQNSIHLPVSLNTSKYIVIATFCSTSDWPQYISGAVPNVGNRSTSQFVVRGAYDGTILHGIDCIIIGF